MLSKNKAKFISSLKKKKFRNETGLFVVEGAKIFEAVVASGFQVELLCTVPGWSHPAVHSGLENIREHITVSEKELSRVSGQKSPNQVLAVVKKPDHKLIKKDLLNELSIVLDRINDPGNLGTIIRIADWFGIKNVVCSPDTVDVYNPKTIQSTMGSVCRVKVHYIDLPEFIGLFRNTADFRIYGTYLEGESIYEARIEKNGILIFGSESHGILPELSSLVTNRLYIPAYAQNSSHKPESLNVAVAAGIVCHEFRRSK